MGNRREDYGRVGEKLGSQFQELAGYLSGPTPPAVSTSVKNLAKYVGLTSQQSGIERQIRLIMGEEEISDPERAEDADEILECYQWIQRLLERISVSILQASMDAALSLLKFSGDANV